LTAPQIEKLKAANEEQSRQLREFKAAGERVVNSFILSGRFPSTAHFWYQ
jgi:hypothetical protein